MRGLTIARVAAEAGVGVGTVSRVLNGSPSVSEDTRRRVLEAIATLDYQPSAVARALSTGRTHAIGVVAPVLHAALGDRAAARHLPRARGVGLPARPVRRRARRTSGATRSARSPMRGRVDGVLSISLAPTDARGGAARGRGHADRARRPRARRRCPRSRIDDVDGGRIAAEHLLGARPPRDRLRRRRGGEPVRVRLERAPAHGLRGGAGRRRGAAAPGLEHARPARPRGRARVRRRAARARRSGRPPIFASSDVQAIGVLEAARAAGVPVPGGAVGHRLRRRRGRRLRGADDDHAVAGGERRPRRRPAAACARRRARREPAGCRSQVVERRTTAPRIARSREEG